MGAFLLLFGSRGKYIPLAPRWNEIGSDHWTRWKNYLEYLISCNPIKTENISTIDTNDVALHKWWNCVLAPNGYIYGSQSTNATFLKIDPHNSSFSLFGNITPTIQGHTTGGAILAPNGYIYIIPRNFTSVIKLNPLDDTYELLGSFPEGGFKYGSAVLAPNGIIYGIPVLATNFLKINTNTDEVTTFGTVASGEAWGGAILAPNGYIYGFPYSSDGVSGHYTILKLNPNDDTFTKSGNFIAGGNFQYRGSILAPNGCIYAIPHLETSILKFDPTNDTYTTLTVLDGDNYYNMGFLAPNGCIYLPPSNAPNILRINTADDSLHTFGDFSALPGTKITGVAMGFDGCLYSTPLNYRYILKIDLGLSLLPSSEYCLAPWFRSFTVG